MLVDLLRVAGSLAVAAHDLDLIRMDCLARVLHLECNILDQEGPDLIAEAVGIEMTLLFPSAFVPTFASQPPEVGIP